MNIAVYVTSNYANYDRLSKMLSKCLHRYTSEPVILTSISKSTKPGHGNLLVKRYADENHLRCKVYETEWAKWRRSAGSIASYHMNHNSERAIVMWDGLSKGCRNFLQLAKRLRRPCDLIRVNPNDGVEVPPKDIQPETPLTHGGVVRPAAPNAPAQTPPQTGAQQQMSVPGPATPPPGTTSAGSAPVPQTDAPTPVAASTPAVGQQPVQPKNQNAPQNGPEAPTQGNPPTPGTTPAQNSTPPTQASPDGAHPTANASQQTPPSAQTPANAQGQDAGIGGNPTTTGTPPASEQQTANASDNQPPASEQTLEQLTGPETED